MTFKPGEIYIEHYTKDVVRVLKSVNRRRVHVNVLYSGIDRRFNKNGINKEIFLKNNCILMTLDNLKKIIEKHNKFNDCVFNIMEKIIYSLENNKSKKEIGAIIKGNQSGNIYEIVKNECDDWSDDLFVNTLLRPFDNRFNFTENSRYVSSRMCSLVEDINNLEDMIEENNNERVINFI